MSENKVQNPDFIIFEDKTFSDLAQDIYTTSKKKELQIDNLISQLKPLVTSVGAAQAIVPLVKEYLEVGVKNDEQLVKLAAVLQRHVSSLQRMKGGGSSSDEFILSEEEKLQLLQLAEQEIKDIKDII